MKLNKMYYYKKDKKEVNCYIARISKTILKNTNIKDDDEVEVKAVNNKIVIEKSSK